MLRINSIEKISDEPPGEMGKLLGLDRIPEVKTIRKKIACLSQNEQPDKWLSRLSKDWMVNAPDLAGVLYIDGHEEVYYGKKNKLPRRYISRLRLAMRGTTDYWVNDKLGQPFFSVSKHVSGSMIETIKQDIIPRLEKDVPNQPTEEMLEQDSHLHRFMLVYDRECYSEDFMIGSWKKRIACCTYNKYVKDKWSEKEFKEYEVENEFGEKEKIQLKRKKDKALFLLITTQFFKNNPHSRLYGYKMEEYKSNPMSLMADISHRKDIEPSEWEQIAKCIEWITWEDIIKI